MLPPDFSISFKEYCTFIADVSLLFTGTYLAFEFLKALLFKLLPLSGFGRLSTNVPLSQCLLPPRLVSIPSRWNKSVFAGRNAPAGQRPSAPRVGACPLRGSRLRARAELGAGAVSPGGVTGRPRAAAGSRPLEVAERLRASLLGPLVVELLRRQSSSSKI